MTQAAVEALRLVYEQFGRGEFGAIEALSDDVVLISAPEMPDAGTYHGADAREWLLTWVASFESLKFEATEFIDAGDRVLVELIQSGIPRGGTTPVQLPTWTVITMRDDLTTQQMQLFMNRDDASQAAGLAD